MIEENKCKKSPKEKERSIEEICSSTWETLYRFIYYKVQNRQEAEEITQDTYVKAIAYFQKSNVHIDQHIGYLKTISLNVLRDKWRKSKRQGTVIDIDAIRPEEAAVEDTAEASAQRDLIRAAMDRLSEEQRTVIDLRIIKGHSAAEAADIMNKKEGTIRVLQYRALQNLAAILKNKD
ncbi:MAG: polymerase, sigma-24 subunit, subfamily [Clostridia bacterium]|jgi:RNA polymerase sigma-70 factor (ECF subfamily)|nr:polymerase, sigma-24 subunit, subfamily [Clostridia bacterium]